MEIHGQRDWSTLQAFYGIEEYFFTESIQAREVPKSKK